MEKTIEDLYTYIQELKITSGVDINYLNDVQVREIINNKQLSLKQICAICEIRYWYNVVVMDNLKVIDRKEDESCDTTIETNLSFISNKGSEYGKKRDDNINEFGVNTYYLSEHKVKSFNQALLNVEDIKLNRDKLKILYIGARTEAEILAMSKFGFNLNNIQAIDLYSYSSMIKLGDMHNIPFKENSFDLVIMTHCIAYSEKPAKAYAEAIRVTKSKGHIMFSVSTIKGQKSKAESIPRTGAKNIMNFESYLSELNSLGHTEKTYKLEDRSKTMKIGVVRLNK